MAAPRKISGKLIVLEVNQGTEESPQWQPFACATANGFSGSTDTVETASKCDAEGYSQAEPGNKTWEFTQTAYGIREEDLEGNQVSHQTAAELWKASEIREFRMRSEDLSYVRRGTGLITNYDETANDNEYLTFDITITGTGEVFFEDAV